MFGLARFLAIMGGLYYAMKQFDLRIEGHKLLALRLNDTTSGQPIILIHGVSLSPYFWLTDDLFLEHGPCYALSLPGHTPAGFPADFRAEDFTAEMIAHLMTAAIRELVGDQPVTLVGISTGGFTALNIAAYAPALVQRVISISGFAQGRWIGALGVYQRLARLGRIGKLLFKFGFALSQRSRAAFRNETWPFFVVHKQTFYAYPRLDQLIDDLYPHWKTQNMEATFLYCKVMPDIDISAILPNITARTLLLVGDRDPIVPPAQATLIAGHIPHAELSVFQEAGHLLFAENPAEYQRVIQDWLCRTSVNPALA